MILSIIICVLLFLLGGYCCITLCIWSTHPEEDFTKKDVALNFVLWPFITIHNIFLTITYKDPKE